MARTNEQDMTHVQKDCHLFFQHYFMRILMVKVTKFSNKHKEGFFDKS